MTEKLHVFTDDHDWFIARDMNHVKELFLSFFGESFEDLDINETDWYRESDDEIITIAVYKDDFNPDNMLFPEIHVIEFDRDLVKIKATAAEWVKISESGLLCSLDW